MNSVVPREVAYKSSVDFKNPVLLQKFDRLFRTQTVVKKQATLMIAGILYNFWNLNFRKHQNNLNLIIQFVFVITKQIQTSIQN